MAHSPDEVRLPPHLAEKARTAVLLGTRALIADSHFDALVAILVASGAVPVERAQTMLYNLSATMTGYAESGHPEFQTQPAELSLHADRLRRQAEAMG